MAAFCSTRQYLTMFTSPGNKTAPTRIWQLTFITRGIVPSLIYYNGPLSVPFLRKSHYSLPICIANLFTYLVCNVCLTCDWLLMKSLLVSWRLSLVFSRVTVRTGITDVELSLNKTMCSVCTVWVQSFISYRVRCKISDHATRWRL